MDMILDTLCRWFYKLKYLFRKNAAQPFLVARKTTPKHFSENDKVNFQMICPACQCHWADVSAHLGSNVVPENFTIREPYTAFVKIQPMRPLNCPACGWEYTNWAIQALVLSAMNRAVLDKKIAEKKNSFWGG